MGQTAATPAAHTLLSNVQTMLAVVSGQRQGSTHARAKHTLQVLSHITLIKRPLALTPPSSGRWLNVCGASTSQPRAPVWLRTRNTLLSLHHLIQGQRQQQIIGSNRQTVTDVLAHAAYLEFLSCQTVLPMCVGHTRQRR